jgi:pimeloyl-ACP methyl ester carboxylesterase
MHKFGATALLAILVVGLAFTAIPVVIPATKASDPTVPFGGWTLIAQRPEKAYPDLTETVWEANCTTPPYGPYDMIGLHRVVKMGIQPLGVLFICPGTWSSGEQLISNPPTDTWTKTENDTEAFYWANRGWDVYSMDYRTHFVPITLSSSQLSFMADWGWTQWIGDIKQAVDMAKEVSGAQRIYMAGESFGGIAAMNYASLYWNQDLKGLIMLDGGGTGIKNPNPTNSYNLTAAIAQMIATGTWSTEVSGPGAIFAFQYADQYPGAPAEFPPGTPLQPTINPMTGQPWANISEWAAFVIYYAWGPAGVSNIYGGYGNATVDIHIMATFDRYWPTRLSLETAAYTDWVNCPYLPYDFDDHYSSIDVPLISFTSQYLGLATFGPFQHGIANPDFTETILWGYGHLDVFSGVYCARDVSAPTYDWMITHRMLVGFGGINLGGNWIYGETTIYINSTTIDFKVDGVRVPWNIVSHWTCSYRWSRAPVACGYLYDEKVEFYTGESELGQITIYIWMRSALAAGPKIFFYGYLV